MERNCKEFNSTSKYILLSMVQINKKQNWIWGKDSIVSLRNGMYEFVWGRKKVTDKNEMVNYDLADMLIPTETEKIMG